jgi:vitamin K-dependent gamma-carboxylase
LGYAIKDKVTGQVADGQVNRFLNPEQSERFGRDPEMVLHFAHFLGNEYRRATGHEASVHVLALASLNGRKPVLMVDPNVDLMADVRGFQRREWLMPQTEPLRQPYWDVPPEQWRQFVEIPELKFMPQAASAGADPDQHQELTATSN